MLKKFSTALLIVLSTYCTVWAIDSPIRKRCRVYPPSFPQSEQLSPYTIRVPFQLVGRLIIVQAEVEGLSGNFILDTGSSDLILNTVHFSGGFIKSSTSTTGSIGDVGEIRTKKIRDILLDSVPLPKVSADLIDLSYIEKKKNVEILGMLGYEVLKAYELLIDFQLRQITMVQTDERGERLDSLAIAEPPYDSLSVKFSHHILILNGTVGEQPVRFGLDTGAEVNLLNRRVKRPVLEHFEANEAMELTDVGGRSMKVLAGMLYDFRSGRQCCAGMRTILINMDGLNRIYRSSLDGLLGYEFLSTRRTLINYQKRKLYFLKWHQP